MRPQRMEETEEEYQERLKRQREEARRAEERRIKEEAERKRVRERERQEEARTAASRRQAKADARKTDREEKIRADAERVKQAKLDVQKKRLAVFAAARKGQYEAVKKGVWEEDVDAAGGEVRSGAEDAVKPSPRDPKETLLHIVARLGNQEIVEWLVDHSKSSTSLKPRIN